MLRSIGEITGYEIRGRDGRIGTVADFWFDDVGWFVRYVVADTGRWLSGRRIPLAPEAFGQPIWDERVLPVGLDRSTIERAPRTEEVRPVSRQREAVLRSFYGWPAWWAMPTQGLLAPSAKELVEARTEEVTLAARDADPHLRSTVEVTGYHIEARDGGIGHVEDLIVDDVTWALCYVVVDTRNVLPGKKVLLAVPWIDGIRWEEERMSVGLNREQIRTGPQYDPGAPINRRYEERLYDFYGRPTSWR